MMKVKNIIIYVLTLCICMLVSGCSQEELYHSVELLSMISDYTNSEISGILDQREANVVLENIPEYSGDAVAIINDNNPQFSELVMESYEYYSELDYLGRCGVAHASLGMDLMPTEQRESISQVKPSGWLNKEYDIVEGGYLYNRCHLIGFQLAGENANEKNLITGTKYMNSPIMTKYENAIAGYIKETGNHVMYRVTPMYQGSDLVAKGIQIEGYSVEDQGEGVCFNVFLYNEQPGIIIDHGTGESWLDEEHEIKVIEDVLGDDIEHVLNTSSLKIHQPSCSSVKKINDGNRKNTDMDVEELFKLGYTLCGSCY